MARLLGNSLPESLQARYRGEVGPGPEYEAIVLICNDADGWPRPFVLSQGEVIVVGPRQIRAAIWRGSTASRRLREDPRLTLVLVDGGAAYYVKGTATEVPAAFADFEALTRFDLQVEQVIYDHDPNGSITGGIRFTVGNAEEMRDLWEKVLPRLTTEDG